jgi:acyl carrier protein
MAPRDTVLKTILQVCADKGRAPAQLNDDDLLGEGGLGLDSLDMATIVSELDARLDIDPFANGTPSLRTVGEFVRLFEGGNPA